MSVTYFSCVFKQPVSNSLEQVRGLFLILVIIFLMCIGMLCITLDFGADLELSYCSYSLQQAKGVWSSAGWLGSREGVDQWSYLNAFQIDYDYFVAYLADAFGKLPAVLFLMLYVILFGKLFAGASRQKALLDRCICLGCSFWLLYQTIANLYSNFLLMTDTTEYLPFSGMNPWSGFSSIFMLFVYMAFYHAHSRKQKKRRVGLDERVWRWERRAQFFEQLYKEKI